MLTHLEMDLEQLKIKIFRMADYTMEAVSSSVSSLKNSDFDMARKIINNDERINRLEIEIDEECIKFLVTRQPAASDLRLILAMLKINTDLERIADLATTIAKETLRINGTPLIKPLIDIPRMSEIAVKMINTAFTALTDKDVEKAKGVIEMDAEIDDLNLQIYRELFTYMGESSKNISQSLSLINVAKALERIGDHTKNIAERAVYYIQGEDIRHQKPKI
ncbi:MAG TPA: phosphate signaling complex protein PhoU [Spirochaetota bacterium]|nr:phosphate signaling complex protein PhoU [Spirochaetota bacterium]HPS87461.1 phosphate signaling complex protein PhoU [Spirochaetota bacterium]